MEAGLLKEVITIERPVVVKDEFGANKIDWETFIEKTRAGVSYNSGNRVNENNEIIFAYTVIFTIRLYHNIDERMRILWNKNKYRILSKEIDKH